MSEEIDILKHRLVPKHEILSEEEKKKVLAELRVQAYQLPWIESTDPVVQRIGGKVGDVIRITRDSSTAGKTTVYRVVVEG